MTAFLENKQKLDMNFDGLNLTLSGLHKGDSDLIADFLIGMGFEVCCMNIREHQEDHIQKGKWIADVSMFKRK